MEELISQTQLNIAAAVAVSRLGVKETERVLIVAGEGREDIARALDAACTARSARAELVTVKEEEAGREATPQIAAALRAADVAFLVTRFSMSHTDARRGATVAGTRIASMPGITASVFARTIPVDYERIERHSRELARRLTTARRCLVTSPAGTNVELALDGREGRADDGELGDAGSFGNLPAGEGYIAPIEHAGSGTIVFDGSVALLGQLAKPLTVHLVSGRVEDAEGDLADAFLDALDSGGSHGRSVAELGIGTNPSAKINGLILEDEKVEGTAHIAFGTSAGLGGVVAAGIHIDGLLINPTVELDGDVVLSDGRLSIGENAAS